MKSRKKARIKPGKAARGRRVPDTAITQRGDHSRDRLIEATRALMAKRGTIDITLIEIAEEAALNSALVKYHFGNKDRLFLAVLLAASESGMSALRTLLESDLTPEEKLERHIAGMIITYRKHPYISELVQYFLRGPDRPERRAVMDQHIRLFTSLQAELLKDGVQRGRFRKVDPTLFYLDISGACTQIVDAKSIVGAAFGLTETRELRDKYIKHVVDMRFRGMLVD